MFNVFIRCLLMIIVFLPAAALAESTIEIKGDWIRETPPLSTVTAGYMTIINKGKEGDKLTSVWSDIAKYVEFHTTEYEENGMAMMKKLDSIPVEADAETQLAPGKTHLMFIGLTKPIKEGQEVHLVLEFEKAGSVMVMAPVKREMTHEDYDSEMKHDHHESDHEGSEGHDHRINYDEHNH